jgi:acyl-CoA thioesterase FadM
MMKLARIEFSYEIRRVNEEALIAEGSTLLACLGANKKPMAIPEKIRDALS